MCLPHFCHRFRSAKEGTRARWPTINTGFGLSANIVTLWWRPGSWSGPRNTSSGRTPPGRATRSPSRRTRMLLALRMNTLARGHSGVRPEVSR